MYQNGNFLVGLLYISTGTNRDSDIFKLKGVVDIQFLILLTNRETPSFQRYACACANLNLFYN
jgi:hypothetical protein